MRFADPPCLTSMQTTTANVTGRYADINGLHLYCGTTLLVAGDADQAPPSHYVEMFKLLGGGLRLGVWMGENRPQGGHGLGILPGLQHYNLFASPLFAAVVLDFLDQS